MRMVVRYANTRRPLSGVLAAPVMPLPSADGSPFSFADVEGDGMNRQGPEESQPAAEPIISAPVGRRSVLRGMGAGAVTVGAGGLLAACSSGIKGSGQQSSSGTITIGFVTPLTGPLAGFASGDQYVLSQVRNTSA